MKVALVVSAQFVLFVVTFAAGAFAMPFHLQSVLLQTGSATRLFVLDGFLLCLVMFAIILATEALRERWRRAAPWTGLALVLAIAVSLALKLGFVTREF